LLGYFFNELAALIGAMSLLTYAFIYTPLKRISPIAVLVGAIPGALPPVIGWVAATATLSYETYVLFAIQFLWQFPHFWAISWLADEEYRKAGYKLSPESGGKSKFIAFQMLIYISVLMLVSLLPIALGIVSYYFAIVAIALGIMFLYKAAVLYNTCTDKAALQVMFASLIYLPVLQVAMVLDHIFIV